MKIKCPYCNQSYELTDEELFSIGNQDLECANCHKQFDLREVVAAFEEYMTTVAELARDIRKETEETAAEKENLKMAKEEIKHMKDVDYDTERDIIDREQNLESAIDNIKTMKEDLATAKKDYKWTAKESMMKEDKAEDDYKERIFNAFEAGYLKSPLEPNDKMKIMNYMIMGNCSDVLEEVFSSEKFRYCLNDEVAEIADRLRHDEYLPLIGIPEGSDGTITPKQLALLVRFGFDESRMSQLSKSSASTLISRILNENGFAKSEWKEKLLNCEDRDELREAIARFHAAQLVIPPPKEG
jgi:hypothetical protein